MTRRPSYGTLLLILAVGLRLASTPTANASYAVLGVCALFGPAYVVRALACSWLFTLLSSGVAPAATGSGGGRYVVLSLAAISVMVRWRPLRSGFAVRKVTLATLLLGAFFFLHSLFFSPMLDISLLKSVSWTLAMCTLVAAWLQLSVEGRRQVELQIFGGLASVMTLSLPLIFMPQGYLRNGTGFQGIMSHPQAFGPAMALLGAWSVSRMLAARTPTWASAFLATAAFGMTILSEARTAALSMLLGVAGAMLVVPLISKRRIRDLIPGLRSPRLLLLAGCAAAAMALAADRVEEGFNHFITKSGRADVDSVFEAYGDSRGGLAESMWENIKEHPIVGIGFGIASDEASMIIERDPLLGLPTSATVEKGVLPLAVWEEVGLLGLIAVCLWLSQLLRVASRAGIVPVAVGLTALLLNMGESTLFSPGGMGLLTLVLLGWAFASGHLRQ